MSLKSVVVSNENQKIKTKWLNINKMKRFFTLIIISFFASSILAQSIDFNQGSIKQKKYLEKIPYQNKDGKLIVPVTINGKTYNFLLDTGASFTISDELFKELNLEIIGNQETRDVSGKVMKMRVISLPELHLQGITFLDTPGYVFHEESPDITDILKCFGIDGIIGSNMLRNSVIQFNLRSKHILISNNFWQIPKNKVVKSQKMKLSPAQSSPFIRVAHQQIGRKRIGNYVLFDTGASDFYTMSMHSYNWLNSRVDMTKIAESEGSFAWGIHGPAEKQPHLLLIIPELNINKTIFNDVVATTTNTISLMGTKLLQYGKVTLDYKRKFFYFEPFENINTDELSQRPRAILPTMQNGKLVVGIIWDKALESQINLGDEILSINGINIQTMSVCELFNFDNTSSNDEELILELNDIKTGEIKKVEIKRL